jgi:NADPH-dependent 2,4-dienoyl-CoA reductase/sulfur reductase-like enzyme
MGTGMAYVLALTGHPVTLVEPDGGPRGPRAPWFGGKLTEAR